MKKSLILFICILVVSLYFIFHLNSVNSQEITTPEVVPGMTPENLEKVQTGIEKLTEEEERSQYLKQEWGKILQNNTYYKQYIKPAVDEYNKVRPYTDPFFIYTIGMAPSLSWLFVLTLVLWIAFVVYIARMFSLMPFFSKFTQNVIALGIIIIFSVSGITKRIAEQIIKMISGFDTTKQLIAVVIIIVLIILLSIFSKHFKEAIKKYQKKEEEKLDREKLKGEVKVAEALTKGITK